MGLGHSHFRLRAQLLVSVWMTQESWQLSRWKEERVNIEMHSFFATQNPVLAEQLTLYWRCDTVFVQDKHK